MLRRAPSSADGKVGAGAGAGASNNDDPKGRYHRKNGMREAPSLTTTTALLSIALLLGMVLQYSMHVVEHIEGEAIPDGCPACASSENDDSRLFSLEPVALAKRVLPHDFHPLLDRAMQSQGHCKTLRLVDDPYATSKVTPKAVASNADFFNNHTAHLPQFGIIQSANNYAASVESGKLKPGDYPYRCQLPPENECAETKFTVIFMAYNPDRLQKLYTQIKKMVTESEFATMVEEVVVVWNGERQVEETDLGKTLVDFGKTSPVRISYPLKAGFPNDLMNRYHPRLALKTKAIMYYDDDGPFYSFEATKAGFELWKRNSNAQIGAMARKLDLGPRQADERKAILNGPGDRFFVSQCPTDEIRYNYNEFANFGANMVLPSGSFLHSNYLCFLWHPLFADIRSYVKKHPVNPDDGTVSILVSQLSGRAPKVYSRRLNSLNPNEQGRRRLMDGIDWDAKGSHSDKKNKWGRLRSDAANSLVRYFGSMNSGSIGWCYGTEYQQGGYCKPEMAKIGMLPWMNKDNSPREACP